MHSGTLRGGPFSRAPRVLGQSRCEQDLNLRITVLETVPLPLGYRTINYSTVTLFARLRG